MTPTPRPNLELQNLTRRIRNSLPDGVRTLRLSRVRLSRARLSRKSAAYVAGGLVLAGVAGATAAVGFSGQPAGTAGLPAAADGSGRAHIVKRHTVAAKHASANHAAAKHGATKQPGGNHGPTKHEAAKHQAANRGPAKDEATKRAATKQAVAKHGAVGPPPKTWSDVMRIVANRTFPQPGNGQLPPRDRLTPVGTSGPQEWMQITPARYENAKTIVAQAINEHMGLRSAVIAVATAMQESTLLNLPYGDQDSVGLFQQRPSSGWGTASQIQHPSYAASAFLGALRGYQAQNPEWANQPLWESAQGVQRSAFPSAYAKWESQAAQLVASVAKQLI